MRRTILSSLVLIPVLAHAQAPSTQAATQTVQPATNLQARNNAPALPAAAPAAAPVPHKIAFVDTINAQVINTANDEIMRQGGTLSYTLFNDPASSLVAPKIIHTVNRNLPLQQLNPSDLKEVTVQVTVDERGVPQNPTIVRSGGGQLDLPTLAAVRAYRFQPATEHGTPVVSTLTIDFQLHTN